MEKNKVLMPKKRLLVLINTKRTILMEVINIVNIDGNTAKGSKRHGLFY